MIFHPALRPSLRPHRPANHAQPTKTLIFPTTVSEQLSDLTARVIEGAPHLLASRPGVNALVHILGSANPKQRKVFLKEIKNQVKIAPINRGVTIRGIRLIANCFGPAGGAELRTFSTAPTSDDKIM